jgi:hypothetical protein
VLALLQRDEGERLTYPALLLLQKWGPDAKAAIPQLRNMLKNRPIGDRVLLHETLVHIAGDRDSLTAIIAALADERVGHLAAEILGDLGPRAKEAVPVLRTRLADPKTPAMQVIKMEEALRKIEGK